MRINEELLANIVRDIFRGGSRQAQNTLNIHLFREASNLFKVRRVRLKVKVRNIPSGILV